jgi:hypothetical protein
MVSNNLLTPSSTPGGAELAARDREALRVAREWLNDPRFATCDARVRTIVSRLERFVNPQGNSGKP